jgi:hypothetical protein
MLVGDRADVARAGEGAITTCPRPGRDVEVLETCRTAALGGHRRHATRAEPSGSPTTPVATDTARSARPWRKSAGSLPGAPSCCPSEDALMLVRERAGRRSITLHVAVDT